MFTAKDYDKALLTPEQVFQSPLEVVETGSLTAAQKLKVLKRWEADAHDMSVAADESMTGGEPSRFSEVRQAIHSICDSEHIDENGEPLA